MRVIIDIEACKGCGICLANCPKKILVLSQVRNKKGYLVPEVTDHEQCSNCLACEMLCPDLAIYVAAEKEQTDAA